MEVVILCGGIGTRLKEETEFRPKPMVTIGGRPILWHIMKIYAHYGYGEFVLCLGYKGEMIKEYFYNYEILANDFQITLGQKNAIEIFHNHDEKNWKITMANTGDEALKGARLKKVEKYIHGDTFMLTYGDGLSDVSIADLLEFHKSHGKLATVTGINPTARFGELKLEGNLVRAFREKPESFTKFVNGGFFVFERRILDYLSADDKCDLEIGPLEQIANEGQLMVYKHNGFWACMDTLRDMEYLNRLWVENKAPWKIW
jgi:glucose-1-phosphate cytidylyltransferase